MKNKIPYQHRIDIRSEDIDVLGHVNNVVYVRWVQEVAEAHWENVAPSDVKAKYVWVVLRHEIDYKNPAFLKDEITGFTWVGEHNGARFERFVKIQCASKILAEAKTTWCLLDAKSLRPIRIPNEILELR